MDKAPYDDATEFNKRARSHAIVGSNGEVETFGTPDKRVGEYAIIYAAILLA